jgi:hypothetical protein
MVLLMIQKKNSDHLQKVIGNSETKKDFSISNPYLTTIFFISKLSIGNLKRIVKVVTINKMLFFTMHF